jgi:CubicO group peptidase (beta-lactamase class C family)
MSSGIAWDNTQHTNEFINLKASEDPLTYIFNKESTFRPGTRFNYSDATAHLMAEVLYYATGKLPLEYASEKLFEPLGIDSVIWSDARDGVQIGGCDLHLSLSEMQKIGQLVLNEGSYDGQQLIAANWIQTCTSSKITTGSYGGYDESYGYYYWLGQVGELETYSCLGHGGQFIIIIPEKNTVITASTIGGVSDQKAYEQFGGVSRILYQQLIPLL